jgi:hypothetical protein
MPPCLAGSPPADPRHKRDGFLPTGREPSSDLPLNRCATFLSNPTVARSSKTYVPVGLAGRLIKGELQFHLGIYNVFRGYNMNSRHCLLQHPFRYLEPAVVDRREYLY